MRQEERIEHHADTKDVSLGWKRERTSKQMDKNEAHSTEEGKEQHHVDALQKVDDLGHETIDATQHE